MMWWNQRKASTGSSRAGSRSSRTSRSSTRGSQPREIEFQFFIRQTETLYPAWWTREGVIEWYRDLPDDTTWNCFICGAVLAALVMEITRFESFFLDILDVIYNISYAIHVFAIGYKIVAELENTDITCWTVLAFLVDFTTFAHYAQTNNHNFKLICYYARLHRPFRYLWSLNDYNLKGSILGITLKYIYIFLVLRITWAYVWLHIDVINRYYRHHKLETQPSTSRVLTMMQSADETAASKFLSAVYIINKMFIPIGPSVYPDDDVERIVCLLIMITGCLVVTGAAVASLSLVISLYMRPEETFRSRYRLIMKEMKETQVPQSLREKVETFYKMYWHKQKAVSETHLLPIFPPTLPTTIKADIYFEATQKARILRELSCQLLSELSKKMQTIHYIPGDAIIKRGAKKCKIIYITYGDVEMLTAEDDTTAILRMTRGTVITPCGGAVAAALGVSHLAVRAATFCTAHVLEATDLWRIVYKHSVTQDHAGPILAAFTDHVERVKRHYIMKIPDQAVHKSSILNFNRNLLALKEMRDAEGKSLLATSDVFLDVAGCYIIRNRPDQTLTDQSDEICLRPTFPCILQPDSSLLFAWHSLVALLILIVCITHPYYLVYKKTVPLEFRFFDYIMTVVFIVDHIAYLSTGANVEEGVPITFTQTSSQQMRSHWFVLDVVATLPIFEFIGDGHFAGINKILRLPKLFRVLKSMEETCVYHSNVLRFLSYTLLLLIACYLIAAMQQGFMCFQSGYCLVTNFTHKPFWEQKPLDEETVSARLAFGLYWAISMINFTVHRETWGKENWKNVLYTLVILEICIVLRIFMEAVYSATIMVTTALREDYGARISMVKNFLIRNEVDPQLMKRFVNYLQLCWHTDKAYKISHKNHSTIFYDLPPHVFQDIVGRNRSKYILCIPFMKLLNKEELRIVSSKSQLFYTSPNEILLNTGELTNEIYVIKQGICEIICPKTKEAIGELSTKGHFGALICLLRLPAYYTIRAVTHVQIISIPRKYMLNALAKKQIKGALELLKKQPEYLRLQTAEPSFLKYVAPDPTPNMMHFKLPRKHEPDAAFLHPFNRLGFLSILRYVFPRFTIRPDGTYMVRYEWFRVICALMSAQLFPHYTYLYLQWPFLYYVALLLDLSAWYDIIQRMLVGYFNEKGILIYHPSSTAAYYMKGAFIMDLIGCLKLEDLESRYKDSVGRWFRVTPTEQFLMLNRLIQLYRMPSAMMMLCDYIERRDILMVIKAIPLFMAMLNVLTCFMIFYSVKIFYFQLDDGSYFWSIDPYEDNGGSWLYLFSDAFRFNMTATPWNLHLGTYFWVVYECTTTGYGLFNPSNQSLMQVLFVGMASSTMIITYFSVRIISIRANVNKSLAGFQQNMKDIEVYMIREKLDPELQKEIKRYYEYNWEKMGGIDYRGVLKLCDQITLRTDAILHIYGATFTKCPLLTNADVSLLRIVGRAVHSMYFLRDMKIIEHDDMVTNLYFVDYGGVEIRVTIGEMSSILRLPRGSVFGNLECTKCKRSPYNVVATSRVHLMRIKSLTMANIMADFPSLKELMVKYRTKENKMYILGSEVQAKFRRNVATGPPPRTKKSIMKYIYFQEGLIQPYLMITCMAVIYLDVYNAGFQDNRTWLIITLYCLDIAFYLKILTQHALPFLVLNKNMKKLMLPIRKMYFKGEFRYDFVSVVPIELMSFCSKKNRWMWFAWLRLNRMFRVVTVYKCIRRRNEKITVNLTLTTVMAVMIWFTLFVHTTTSMWHFIGMLEDAKIPNSSWMYTDVTTSSKTKLSDESTSHCDNHYICSMYFIITTFTQNGVGDIMPRNHSEVLFVSVLQILSTMVFMVYVGEFSNIIQFQSYRSFSFYSKYLELQDFLNNNRVSKNLMTMVNKYTLHLWRETRGLQVPHFLKSAPLSLRLRLMSAAYLHHITRHHIFEECEPAFLRQLVGCLKVYTYNEGMYVVKESEITDAMYVIHTGKVQETCEDMDILARVYPAGSYFGIGLIRNTPYTHSYQTMCKSQVLTLQLDDWEYLLSHFPESRDAIHKHMSQVGDKDMDRSNWPGGAPGPIEKPQLTPMTPTDDTGGELPPGEETSPFPGIQRHFGRRSTEEEIPIDRIRRQSQYAWPTYSKGDDDNFEAARRSSTIHEREEDQSPAVNVSAKQSLFGAITNTAKKLMGRISDPDALAAGTEGRDELLLEEDEEATEALLKQFETAQKQTQKKTKRNRRKSIFQQEEEEATEKLLVSLDITSATNLDQPQPLESESSMMRQLRLATDDEGELASTSTRDVLNLSQHRHPKITIKGSKDKSSKADTDKKQVAKGKSTSEVEEEEASVNLDKAGSNISKSTSSIHKPRMLYQDHETSDDANADAHKDASPPVQDMSITVAPKPIKSALHHTESAHGTEGNHDGSEAPKLTKKPTIIIPPKSDEESDSAEEESEKDEVATSTRGAQETPITEAPKLSKENPLKYTDDEAAEHTKPSKETTEAKTDHDAVVTPAVENKPITEAPKPKNIPPFYAEFDDDDDDKVSEAPQPRPHNQPFKKAKIIYEGPKMEDLKTGQASDGATSGADNADDTQTVENVDLEEGTTSMPETDLRLVEFLSDTNVQAVPEATEHRRSSDRRGSIHFAKDSGSKPGASDGKEMQLEEMKEEGTSISASKLNRRFVQVRYEPEKDEKELASAEEEEEEEEDEDEPPPDKHLNIITMDSDEPITTSTEKSVGEGEEGDDEATTTSPSSDSPDTKKKKPFRRTSD